MHVSSSVLPWKLVSTHRLHTHCYDELATGCFIKSTRPRIDYICLIGNKQLSFVCVFLMQANTLKHKNILSA